MALGAMTDDTGEYMLGNVYVNVVLMESDPTLAPRDTNTEDWTPSLINETKQKIEEGLNWWQVTLAQNYPKMAGALTFTLDYTYADMNNLVHTGYEPINRPSTDFQFWMYDFLNIVHYNITGDFHSDVHAYNDAQRTSHNADWSFTIFVVNSDKDIGDTFAAGGFPQAFSFAGGQFMVVPSGRPNSTYSHETGHMFWAKDEYAGGSSYTDRRGYYNAQNLNAADNPANNQQDSIMQSGLTLANAFANHTSPPSTLAMIGWQDTDGDGLFDVVDQPLSLSGTGFRDPQTGMYRFVGKTAVQALPNRNSSGLQNDITINKITRAEYRIDNNATWTPVTPPINAYSADLNLSLMIPVGQHGVYLRTIDATTGATSPIFYAANSEQPTSLQVPGINGFVWNDINGNSTWDTNESGLSGWAVQLVDQNNQPLPQSKIEPDDYAVNVPFNNLPGVTLVAIGGNADGSVAAGVSTASTGSKVFENFDFTDSTPRTDWNASGRMLKINFATPVTSLSIDAIGNGGTDYGRLEIYDSANNLLNRYTTGALSLGKVETMTLSRPTADIAYAIAKGHVNSTINLDNLRYGLNSSTVTDARGAYALPNLPAGVYTVHAVPPANWTASGPLAGNQSVTLNVGEIAGPINFREQGAVSPWQNPANPLDVNNNSSVEPLDALVVINYLNNPINPTKLPNPGLGSSPPPYYDVDGDGFATPTDVIQVVNFLNSRGGGEGPASPIGGNGGSGGSSGSQSPADGEGLSPHIVVLMGGRALVSASTVSPSLVSSTPATPASATPAVSPTVVSRFSLLQLFTSSAAAQSNGETLATRLNQWRTDAARHTRLSLVDSIVNDIAPDIATHSPATPSVDDEIEWPHVHDD